MNEAETSGMDGTELEMLNYVGDSITEWLLGYHFFPSVSSQIAFPHIVLHEMSLLTDVWTKNPFPEVR